MKPLKKKPRHRKRQAPNYRVQVTHPHLGRKSIVIPELSAEFDRWESDRWLNPLGRPNIFFPAGVVPPKTCSYCGAAAPEDVLRLIREHEFEPSATGKSYKQYLNPPGYYLRNAIIHEFFSHHENLGKPLLLSNELPKSVLEYKDPTPPIKIYTQHFTNRMMGKFNSLVEDFMKVLDERIEAFESGKNGAKP